MRERVSEPGTVTLVDAELPLARLYCAKLSGDGVDWLAVCVSLGELVAAKSQSSLLSPSERAVAIPPRGKTL